MKTTATWISLLWKTLIGVFLFAAANLAVYRSCEYFHMKQDYGATVQGALEKKNLRVVLVGDSHVAALKNDLLADQAYNLAFGGDGPREIYAKLRRLLTENQGIKTVVLSTDIHMFAEARQISSNRSFADWYLLRTGSPYGLEHRQLFALFNAVPLFNDDFVQYIRKSASNLRKDDGTVQASLEPSPWAARSERDRSEIARLAGEYDHRGAGQQPQAFAWYQRIVDLARSHGAGLITLRFPAHAAYFQGIDEATVGHIDAKLVTLGLPSTLDYRRAFNDPADFADEDHLNEFGALALLDRLEQDTGLKLRKHSLVHFERHAHL